MTIPKGWPKPHFGKVGSPRPSSADYDPGDDDDEELAETPPDVVMALGFDPLDVDWDAEAEAESQD